SSDLLYHYLPQALALRDGRLYARGRSLEVFRQHGNHHRFGEFEELDLAGFDIVLMRQDPPFDMAYITATHLLELLPEDGPLVVNDPASVRNAPEKLFVLHFKELMPGRAEAEARETLHVGGSAVKTERTPRGREICAPVGPSLRQQGLVFAGIDVIGDYMTEINVTSPTGIQEIARLDGVDLSAPIWDAIEARHAARTNRRPA